MARKHEKRVNGTGSVAELKDGRYVAIAWIEGQRIYRYKRTRKDAETALAGLLTGTEPANARRRFAASPCSDGGKTLREWSSEWLGANENRLRPSTILSYRQALSYVLPLIGHEILTDLTAIRLQAVFTELHKQEIGHRKAQQAYTVLRTCLKAAVSMELLTVNAMERVHKPEWRPREKTYWSVPQTRIFLATALASHLRLAPLCALLASTGLRVSEALGLTWEDVDIQQKRLQVRRAFVWMNGECAEVPPKTEAGKRSVSLPMQAVEALSLTPQTAEGRYVFRTDNGTPPRHSHIRETLIALCDAADVPRINVHGLRHVAAAMALKATKDIHAVQRRLGHSRASITMDIYAYVLTDEGDVAAALDAMLSAEAEPLKRQSAQQRDLRNPAGKQRSSIDHPRKGAKAIKARAG